MSDTNDMPEPEKPLNNDPEGGILHPVEVLGIFEAAEEDTIFELEEDPALLPIRDSAIRIQDEMGRVVTIVIGPFEAMSILQGLNERVVDRPLSHDLMRILIDKLGADIEKVVVDDIWQGTFYARILIRQRETNTVIELDSRPSDAIALAVRAKTPVFMAERVLREAGVVELDD